MKEILLNYTNISSDSTLIPGKNGTNNQLKRKNGRRNINRLGKRQDQKIRSRKFGIEQDIRSELSRIFNVMHLF